MTSEIIKSAARHVLTFGGGYLVQSGLLDGGQLELVVGSLTAIIGVAWSVYEKRKAAKA